MAKNYDIPLSNAWIGKGFKAIFKELTPDEHLKKIDVTGAIYVNGKRVQSVVCIAEPTNRYFRIDQSEVFVRKRFCVTKDQKILLKA